MSNKKNFIIDTNVILSDDKVIDKISSNNIFIPYIVLEEIDNFKKESSSKGYCAREFGRRMDKLREKGSLQDGVKMDGGGTLQILKNNFTVDKPSNYDKNDDVILNTAKHLSEEKDNVVLITKDTLLRVKADGAGVKSENYKADRVKDSSIFEPVSEYSVKSSIIDRLNSNKKVLGKNIDSVFNNMHLNEYAIVSNFEGGQHTLIKKTKNYIEKVYEREVYGLNSRNKEQTFAIDALFDDNIDLVAITGKAGVGKTLISLASVLEQVVNSEKFDKAVLTKAMTTVGKDVGYLPGTLREKLDPHLASFYDNFAYLMKNNNAHKKMRDKSGFQELEEQNYVQTQPLSHIRGRSIPNNFMLCDEVQQLNKLEIKAYLSRAGEGTKACILGDVDQIDNPYVDRWSNGLTYTIDKFRGDESFAHIHFEKGERSSLAEKAAHLL